MPRRQTFEKVKKGQVFCIEWPEWHVECAIEDCAVMALIAQQGEVNTLLEAERLMQSGNVADCGISGQWIRRNGLWYCPDHSRQ